MSTLIAANFFGQTNIAYFIHRFERNNNDHRNDCGKCDEIFPRFFYLTLMLSDDYQLRMQLERERAIS